MTDTPATIDDVFAMQERISRSIVEELRARLTPHEEATRGSQVTDPETYELYLRAKHMLGQSLMRIPEATQLLEELAALNEAFRTTILMVTHDIYAASYCKRVIFLRDGSVVNELYAGEQGQKAFYDRILETQSLLGGKQR